MKSPGLVAILALPFLMCFGCDQPDTSRNVTGGSGRWLDITIEDERYYGLAQENFVTRGTTPESEYSSVILSPWDDRPGSGISVNENISTITLPGGEFEIVGRRVCITNPAGTAITMYPDEIPIEAYASREDLQRAVIAIIQKAEQDGADQPATVPESKPEGDENPKPESEVRPQ